MKPENKTVLQMRIDESTLKCVIINMEQTIEQPKISYLVISVVNTGECKGKCVKFGVTDDYKSYISDLQSKNHERIQCYLMEFVDRENSVEELERIMSKYSTFKRFGRWYNIDIEDLCKEIKTLYKNDEADSNDSANVSTAIPQSITTDIPLDEPESKKRKMGENVVPFIPTHKKQTITLNDQPGQLLFSLLQKKSSWNAFEWLMAAIDSASVVQQLSGKN
jgi:hypothetical protein